MKEAQDLVPPSKVTRTPEDSHPVSLVEGAAPGRGGISPAQVKYPGTL